MGHEAAHSRPREDDLHHDYRAILATVAVRPVESVTAGRMMCFQLPVPDVGSSPNSTEKMIISMMPSQNCGTTIPKTATEVVRLSMIVPRFSAEMTPERQTDNDTYDGGHSPQAQAVWKTLYDQPRCRYAVAERVAEI